jgi:serine/threonine-protein kinase RsbW
VIKQKTDKVMVELYIPSILGFEKVAMATAAALAQEIGFSKDRVADLRTAVSEACLNAIEHGNQQDASVQVLVTLTVDGQELQVDVDDQGGGIGAMPDAPDIDEKVAGNSPSRGWGMFLIQNLVDEVRFEKTAKGGNRTRLVVHLNQQ